MGATATLVVSCSSGFDSSSANLAEKTEESVGCPTFKDHFWDALYTFPLEKKAFPDADKMREAFEESLKNGRLKNASDSDRRRLSEELAELYRLLALDSARILSTESDDHDAVLETLASLEMGDRTTPEKENLQEKIESHFEAISRITTDIEKSGAPSCGPSEPTPAPSEPTPAPSEPTPVPPPAAEPQTLLESWRSSRHPAVYGGLKALATAYQSCEAGTIGELDHRTPNVSGISVVGTHPNGAGKKREITNLSQLIRTHPYLGSYQKPASSCFAVLSNPMIYDYGGKPYATNSANSNLDFFRDAGTGTSVLGLDCSGYVYSALATAGLKLKKEGRLKAIGAHGVNSRMYMNPQSNGLTCLDYAQFTSHQSLKPGDILASTGHVILIERVGADPFGISHIKKESDCKSSNVSISRFDFTILQSSPSKGSIGINRIDAAHYLSDGGSMATAMITHAVNACRAKFSGTLTSTSGYANLVRHKGTADCQDSPILLAREECVASCPASPTEIPQP